MDISSGLFWDGQLTELLVNILFIYGVSDYFGFTLLHQSKCSIVFVITQPIIPIGLVFQNRCETRLILLI